MNSLVAFRILKLIVDTYVDLPAPVRPTIPTFSSPLTVRFKFLQHKLALSVSQRSVFEHNFTCCRPVFGRSVLGNDCWCFLFESVVLADTFNGVQFRLRFSRVDTQVAQQGSKARSAWTKPRAAKAPRASETGNSERNDKDEQNQYKSVANEVQSKTEPPGQSQT
jgi:hypothetical protein